jgi:translation initiation factor 2B subunit (eIF-2B alpha/beta/delta family)
MDTVEAAIAAIGQDRRSGSSALLERGVELLRRIGEDRAALEDAAERLCRAQPAMAGFRTLAGVVRISQHPAAAIARFGLQITRAPGAIARNAVGILRLRTRGGPLRLVTLSASQAVETTIGAAARDLAVVTCCAEGRPQLEGRDLARRLAAGGLRIELYTDAAIGVALESAEAVLVGADAVGPDRFINKVGTGALCALAGVVGVPVYVLAGREKVLTGEDFTALERGGGSPDEVWSDAPAGVVALNPYFEEVPLSLASALITDSGII